MEEGGEGSGASFVVVSLTPVVGFEGDAVAVTLSPVLAVVVVIDFLLLMGALVTVFLAVVVTGFPTL